MKIQDLLGLPLKEGINLFHQLSHENMNVMDVKIIKALPKKSKINHYNLKDPYIVRIREIDNNLTEILISYF